MSNPSLGDADSSASGGDSKVFRPDLLVSPETPLPKEPSVDQPAAIQTPFGPNGTPFGAPIG